MEYLENSIYEKIKRWTLNNARNFKLSIILAKLNWCLGIRFESFNSSSVPIYKKLSGKIGSSQQAHMHFHIMLSFQNCNYKLRNFFLSHSRSDFYLVKDRKPVLRDIGLPRLYIHHDVFVFIYMDCLE